ncbi:MAG: hypothetical protein R3F62_22015 [Planctomycetota bacterium]
MSTPEPPPPLVGNALVLRALELSERLGDDAQRELWIHLERASPYDYARVLETLDLARLCDGLASEGWDDEAPAALLELFSEARVRDLPPRVRARLVQALRRGPTFAPVEEALVSIFEETPEHELTALKVAIDAGYPTDLMTLIEGDVDDPGRSEALAARCRAAQGEGRLLLVDVDDTLFASIHDDRYPDDRVYPGARALLQALREGQPAVVALLTARPAALGPATVNTLSGLGIPVQLALTGTIPGLRSNAAMAFNKRAAFLRYRALYPELRALFCGDTGQGDAEVALTLLAEGALDAALLHDVVGLEDDARAALEAEGVIVFETWLGAAAALERAGWISSGQLLRVARFALAEVQELDLGPGPLRDAWARDRAQVAARLEVGLPDVVR